MSDVSFSDIVNKAKAHFNPKPSPIVKWYEFNTRRQGEAESIATYVAELRKIAEYCDYGAVLSDMLRDRLVCGIHKQTIQRRLLLETSLTFDKALEMALAAEAADKDSKRLTVTVLDKDLPTPIGKVRDLPVSGTPGNRSDRGRRVRPKQRGGEKQQGTLNASNQECHRCGGRHDPARCNYKQYECHYCKKKGHLAKVCRKKAKDQDKPEQAHVIETTTEDEREYTMFHVSTVSSKPFQAMVKVNGIPVTMEIDMGASVWIISEETFKLLRSGQSMLELDQSFARLQTYTG